MPSRESSFRGDGFVFVDMSYMPTYSASVYNGHNSRIILPDSFNT